MELAARSSWVIYICIYTIYTYIPGIYIYISVQVSVVISVFMADTLEINDYVDMSPFGRVAYMAVSLQSLAHPSIKVYNMCL